MPKKSQVAKPRVISGTNGIKLNSTRAPASIVMVDVRIKGWPFPFFKMQPIDYSQGF